MKIGLTINTVDDLRVIAREYKYRDVREVAQFALQLLAERTSKQPKPPKAEEAPASWK